MKTDSPLSGPSSPSQDRPSLDAPQLSILIPLYNEVENLDPLIAALLPVLDKIGRTYEILLIDDGSQDGTTEKIVACSREHASIRGVILGTNYGQTAAMMAGFEEARGEILIPMDGDLQNDPEDIPHLLAKMEEGYDLVSGWRRDRKDRDFGRRLPSRIANWLISNVSGVHLHDYGCSLKAYRHRAVVDMHLYGEMHRFIPIYVRWNGARIAEIPVRHHERRFGKSHYGLQRTVKVLFDLLVVMFLLRYSQKPMYVFGACGLVNFGVSFLAMSLAFYYKFFGHKTLIQTPLPVLSAFTCMLGILCFLMGLLAELSIRTYYESRGKKTYGIARRTNFPPEVR